MKGRRRIRRIRAGGDFYTGWDFGKGLALYIARLGTHGVNMYVGQLLRGKEHLETLCITSGSPAMAEYGMLRIALRILTRFYYL